MMVWYWYCKDDASQANSVSKDQGRGCDVDVMMMCDGEWRSMEMLGSCMLCVWRGRMWAEDKSVII